MDEVMGGVAYEPRWTTNDGRVITDIAGIKAYIASIENSADKFEECERLISVLGREASKSLDWIAAVWDLTIESSLWQTHFHTKDDFMAAFDDTKRAVDVHRTAKMRVEEKRRYLEARWGNDPDARGWMAREDYTYSFLNEVARAAKTYTDYKTTMLYTTNAMLQRLSDRRQGVSTKKILMTGDFARARRPGFELRKIDPDPLHLPPSNFSKSTDIQTAFLYPTPEAPPPRGLSPGDISTDDSTKDDARRLSVDTMDGVLMSNTSEGGTGRGGNGGTRPVHSSPLDQQTELAAEEVRVANTSHDMPDDDDTGSAAYAPSLSSNSDEGGSAASEDAGECKCEAHVPAGWKQSVSRKQVYDERRALTYLRRMGEYGIGSICYLHAKETAQRLGLEIKRQKQPVLRARLAVAIQAELENRFGELKDTAGSTWRWFLKDYREAHEEDGLNMYKFGPIFSRLPPQVMDFTHESATRAILHSIYEDAAVVQARMDEWQVYGTVNIDVFSWWWEDRSGGALKTIGSIVDKELEMYYYHKREQENIGWLPNTVYSIGQQLMRQDPRYYSLYVALRPDHNQHLVSYPHYAKFTVPGNKTHFQHIDHNLKLLAEDHCKAAIQGSVSLDDEDPKNCTILIPKMHKEGMLKRWLELLEERDVRVADGLVTKIQADMFTKDIAEELDTDWLAVPCPRGSARISMGQLPHGSTGPATGVRRTFLPWYCGLQQDGVTLEQIRGGTWAELSTAHRDQTSPPWTPSGLHNRFGKLPFRFPASVGISGLSAVSDALICQRRWSAPEVVFEKDIILGNDREAAAKFFKAWQERAVLAANHAFACVERAERQMFGENSFFYKESNLV